MGKFHNVCCLPFLWPKWEQWTSTSTPPITSARPVCSLFVLWREVILIALKLPQPPSIGILAVLQMPHMVSTTPNGLPILPDHLDNQPPRKAPSVLDSSSYHEEICPGPSATVSFIPSMCTAGCSLLWWFAEQWKGFVHILCQTGFGHFGKK